MLIPEKLQRALARVREDLTRMRALADAPRDKLPDGIVPTYFDGETIVCARHDGRARNLRPLFAVAPDGRIFTTPGATMTASRNGRVRLTVRPTKTGPKLVGRLDAIETIELAALVTKAIEVRANK